MLYHTHGVNLLTSLIFLLIPVDGTQSKQGAAINEIDARPTRAVSGVHIRTGYCNYFWEVVQCF